MRPMTSWRGPDGVTVLEAVRIETGNDHGTGCSLSAAIAANLASGAGVLDAVRAAKTFVARGLAGGAAWRLGRGARAHRPFRVVRALPLIPGAPADSGWAR